MMKRTTRLRWRRRLRNSRQQVEGIGTQAEESLERHFIRRLNRLDGVRRFLISWILLLLLLAGLLVTQIRNLSNYYLAPHPSSGGIFVEGEIGSFTNANPMYATNSVDSSVARLMFASLFKYDQRHQLVSDLALSWSVDERGSTYTVNLRKNLHWQDGYPLTASDVVFTYKTIQNPDTKSPLLTSWRGIDVSQKDAFTVIFKLPNALSSFPYSMTNGIVPRHLLSGIPATQLRSVSFNTITPVGAGPFSWGAIEVTGSTPETREQKIELLPNDQYYAGRPKLSQFIIRAFHDEKHMLASFKNHELSAISGISSTPSEYLKDLNIHEYNVPLLSEVMVFLNTTNPILSDVKVRQALTYATDTAKVINSLGFPVLPAKGPLLISQLGYDKNLAQLSYDPASAKKLLDDAGWPVGAKGIRQKAGKNLTITIYSQNNNEYTNVLKQVQKLWQDVGVDAQVMLQPEADLQNTISAHDYDSLVYGISLGVDPDVFPYWHSSQADVRVQNQLNFSRYRSTTADKALEAGRTRSDPTIRAIKYRPFLDAWRNDAPAIALYQPRFLYITRGQVFGLSPSSMVTGTDRYANVENWMINETKSQK